MIQRTLILALALCAPLLSTDARAQGGPTNPICDECNGWLSVPQSGTTSVFCALNLRWTGSIGSASCIELPNNDCGQASCFASVTLQYQSTCPGNDISLVISNGAVTTDPVTFFDAPSTGGAWANVFPGASGFVFCGGWILLVTQISNELDPGIAANSTLLTCQSQSGLCGSF